MIRVLVARILSSFVYLLNKTAHLPRDEKYCIYEIYFRLSREDYVLEKRILLVTARRKIKIISK